MTVYGRLQVSALAGLFAAIALDVGRAGLAHLAAMSALRHWTALLVDVLKGSICKERRREYN